MTWKPIDDGEYNEETTTVNGRHVTIFSDQSEMHWHCRIGDGESFDLDAVDSGDARREAVREALAWGTP